MTLAQQMIADVSDVFLNTSEHAVSATYLTTGKHGVPVSVIINRDEAAGIQIMDMDRVELSTASIWCAEADVPDPIKGDRFEIGDEIWFVEKRTSRDGSGGQWLAATFLNRVTIGKSGRDG